MVKLTQTASWNPRLTNPYRTRYATAGGRYFKVWAETLASLYLVEEITADGEFIDYVGEGGNCVVFRLSDARKLIEEATA